MKERGRGREGEGGRRERERVREEGRSVSYVTSYWHSTDDEIRICDVGYTNLNAYRSV